jgi:hypothetical protein
MSIPKILPDSSNPDYLKRFSKNPSLGVQDINTLIFYEIKYLLVSF